MKKTAMFFAIMLGALFCLGTTAQAQNHSVDVFAGYSFQNSSNSDFFGFGTSAHGYNLAATWNFSRFIGLEGNFAGHNGSNIPESEFSSSGTNIFTEHQSEDDYTYLFGPKLTYAVGHKKNFEMYSHFLVGAAHIHEGLLETGSNCSENNCGTGSFKGTGFGFQTGGGVDWFHGRWGIRILEVDYVRENANLTCRGNNFCSGSGNIETFTGSRNDFRLATGFIYRFGGNKE